MIYNSGKEQYENWMIMEEQFCPEYAGKYESVFCQGNGYMGLRAAYEENYPQTVRGLFVAGTFNQFHEKEVTELPNAADLTELQIFVDGERFHMMSGTATSYQRTLNLKTGLLERRVVWISPKGKKINFCFERFVSLKRLHTIGQRVSISVPDGEADIRIVSQINGRMTNSGSQHFVEGEKSIEDKTYIQAVYQTVQSELNFFFNTAHSFWADGKVVEVNARPFMDRRLIGYSYEFHLEANRKISMEKISNIFTDRDKEWENASFDDLKLASRTNLKETLAIGFDTLFKESAAVWAAEIWIKKDAAIESKHAFDQLAYRFAVYQLTIMTPVHDNRMNIGAKGLSGEGYKGHTFWDTEIFMLPYFSYTDPKAARSLLEYRYLSLEGAHKKAKECGYEGAMYPWESAWIADGEVTPKAGEADIVTGLPMPILTGELEVHISCDVALGVWNYYECTKDQDFMDRYGYEILLDTAIFWQSRLEWREGQNRYELTNVIGPDEYKEHVDNNAYTNYMVHWNIKKAIEICTILRTEKPELYAVLNEKLNLDCVRKSWEEKADLIYLPQPRADDLLPQTDHYLDLKEIDLTKYKACGQIGSIYSDYNNRQISEMQVSKQADVLMLMFQKEGDFPAEVRKKNFYYYEARCLHDSSLSLAIHSIMASDLGEKDLAYHLFERACRIDLGSNMKSSDMGIHAAAMGGIWQSTVLGFGGVRVVDGRLRINPSLPKEWTRLTFSIWYEGVCMEVTASGDGMSVKRLEGDAPVMICHKGKEIELLQEIVCE